ncbi:MAG: CRISPR-associated endonuclease Cas3'' [Clostridia bacterium]|nr:CRISPR-associated endonuclease Cas3'' [Clostridia bacterium]
MNKIYKAHVKDDNEVQTVKEHSENTASLCREFAIDTLKDVMYATGLMHDCGKYQKSFQERIDGKNIRVEHSGCGAVEVRDFYPDALGWMMAYCIAGHHSGIPDGGYKNDQPDMATLQGRLKREFEDYSAYENELKLPKIDYNTFAKFLMRDCGKNVELFIDKFALWLNEQSEANTSRPAWGV